jgi:membrane-associated protein
MVIAIIGVSLLPMAIGFARSHFRTAKSAEHSS